MPHKPNHPWWTKEERQTDEYKEWKANKDAGIESIQSNINTWSSTLDFSNLGGSGGSGGFTMGGINLDTIPSLPSDENIMESIGNVNAFNTTDTLPSLPSITNVGTTPFTGVVNWNAIPGGFQPLPQTAGRNKKLYQLSQFHGGINQKSSPRDIADFECQEATNVTVSQVGRIKVLGDLKSSTSTGLTATTLIDSEIPNAGHGWFIFKSGYSLAATPVAGDYTINVTQDGDDVQLTDGTDTVSLDIANANTHVAPVFYAAGNGLYACDANFGHTTARQCAINVYRVDAGSNQTVTGWKTGKPLIDSPTYDDAAAGSMAAGDVKVKQAQEDATVDGSMIVECTPTGTGTWNGDYYFYVSWLFDGGIETGLTSAGDDDGDDQPSDVIAFSNNTLEFNINLMHDPHATANTELGGDKRIEGGRIYFKKSDGNERYLLGEFNLIDGVKGALDSTFSPWTESSNNYSLGSDIVFDDPPEVYTYASLNGYYANEVYDVSPDINADNASGPAAHDVRYKTAVVGQQGVVFIGNVQFQGKNMPDTMMFSMPGKPAVFPKFNFFDSPSSDGSPIIALAAFQDTILQFKENAMYAINISNPAQFYAEAAFRDCGVFNPCQVFTTSFGVIFANKNGCFIYDGQKVISLTGGKFNIGDWSLSETSSISADGTGVPCVGYDPRSQSIIVLKDIGHESTDTGAWIYNMLTQSWTEGTSFIDNADNDTHSNFQISPNGYLSIIQYDASNPPEAPYTYNIGEAASDVQTITYWTKDFDLGLPSQGKKLFKIYITYKGKGDGLTVAYGVDGETDISTPDLYHFATDSYGGTTDTTPLLDKSSAANLESWHVATLYPDDSTEGKDWNSISLYFNGEVSESFEINDISILYRARPIK